MALIKPKTTYMKHTGQFKAVTRSDYGDSVVSTVTTSACFVYLKEESESAGSNIGGVDFTHKVIFPPSVTAETGYHLTDVVDSDGNSVLSEAEIGMVEEVRHWKRGLVFKQAELKISLL